MQYLLLIYGDETARQQASEADVGQTIAAYTAYTEALQKAGILSGSNRLRPSADGTTVRVANGKTEVLNGPYAETREQLAGYYLIDVPDLDAALSWAARCPGASQGTMEVRPIWVMSR
ncbi:YciI family protein [Variovorax terrae]|uniref:YciI family protein n=1 Tax=Variovorax terrae TaxID=2923278 RepID=A0A9X1VXF7_9BURK|nr:YciI family protein [Variovorax terrae]MCJ0763757.1 YciI family protein [Variovorax terrae]